MMEEAKSKPSPNSYSETGTGQFFREWLSTLSTVFLAGATLCPFLLWCSKGEPWDLGGTFFSGVLAWVCYRWTLSDKPHPSLLMRTVFAIGIPVFWLVFFPVVLWGLGFQ